MEAKKKKKSFKEQDSAVDNSTIIDFPIYLFTTRNHYLTTSTYQKWGTDFSLK